MDKGSRTARKRHIKEKALPGIYNQPEGESDADLTLSRNALAVLQRRYLAKDSEGKVMEAPKEMFRRVAHNLAQGDLFYDPNADVKATEEEFYQLMSSLDFLPNSPTMMNAGRELQQLSACFVLPVEDSMESIFESAKHTALIHKSGGGTGFAFSNLRPMSDRVGSTGGVASGPVSFIRVFDTATDVVKQGGTRRGANMGILNVNHPDIMRFIHSKDDDVSLQNFNISVAVTEAFMETVEKGEDYDLINPHTKKAMGKLNARRVFDDMVESAWRTGDPGIIFIDRMNDARSNPVPKRGPIQATNPCGEQPLYPYDSCNLGSINLANFVKEGPTIDWERLSKTVGLCIHLLDNVIDMNRYPIPQIEETSKNVRRIGLGVMGWADLLILMGVPYDSQEALDLGEKMMEFINSAAADASEELAGIRGNFPDWEGSVYDPQGPLGPRPLRNSTRTTIAPTGTISIIANCSSGIEPLFALSYVRNVMDNTRLIEVNPYFEETAKREGFYSEELMAKLAQRGSVKGLDEVPQWVQRLFVTSHDLSPDWHVKMQVAFQKHTDNAVSKTVNFPNHATVEDVRRVYMLAYREGCKGVTIYRDGSKSTQVLSTGQTESKRDNEEEVKAYSASSITPRKRPSMINGVTERVRTGHGNMYVTINFDDREQPFEVFSTLGKAGGCDSAQLEAISRLISLALRSGINATQIVEQLRGITCCPSWDEGTLVRSAPDAVALALSRRVLLQRKGVSPETSSKRSVESLTADHEETESEGPFVAFQPGLFVDDSIDGNKNPGHSEINDGKIINLRSRCPECTTPLVYQEGCYTCRGCGYNKCE